MQLCLNFFCHMQSEQHMGGLNAFKVMPKRKLPALKRGYFGILSFD